MTIGGLEEQLREYQHYNPERVESWDSLHIIEEDVVHFNSSRIIYFWSLSILGDRISVVVPGILARERYRTDLKGNAYSLVKPVPEEAKPSLVATIWSEFIKKPNAIQLQITRFGIFRFDYWSSSDAAQRPQQRE